MKKESLIAPLILFISLSLVSCTTVTAKLQKNNPEMYNDIVGSWYILSDTDFGKQTYTLTFNKNGSISGDVKSIFGIEPLSWRPFLMESGSYPVIIEKRGYIGIEGRGMQITLSYSYDSESLRWSVPKIYEGKLPPLRSFRAGSRTVYVYTKDSDELNRLNDEFARMNDSERKSWNSIDKTSVKATSEYLATVTGDELKKEVEDTLHALLDKKVIKYIQRRSRVLSQYAETMIIYEDGTELCRLFELIKVPVLSYFKNSGTKPVKIDFNNEGNGKFNIQFTTSETNISLRFAINNNKIVIIGLSDGFSVNKQGWEYAVIALASSWNQYPDSEYLDIDLLNKL